MKWYIKGSRRLIPVLIRGVISLGHLVCLGFAFVFALGAFPVSVNAENTGFDRELVEAWVQARGGDGSGPVYWYASGEYRSFPEGKLIAVLEGMATDLLVKDDGDPNVYHVLHREVFVYRDPVTNEVIKELDGKPVRVLAMPYQYYIFSFDGENFDLTVEVGQGKRKRAVKLNDSQARRIGDTMLISMPMFVGGKAYAHYDWIINPGDEKAPFQCSWIRFNDYQRHPSPSKSVMTAYSWQVKRFEDIPASMRTFVLEEMPMYRYPPQSIAEIRRIQSEE